MIVYLNISSMELHLPTQPQLVYTISLELNVLGVDLSLVLRHMGEVLEELGITAVIAVVGILKNITIFMNFGQTFIFRHSCNNHNNHCFHNINISYISLLFIPDII